MTVLQSWQHWMHSEMLKWKCPSALCHGILYHLTHIRTLRHNNNTHYTTLHYTTLISTMYHPPQTKLTKYSYKMTGVAGQNLPSKFALVEVESSLVSFQLLWKAWTDSPLQTKKTGVSYWVSSARCVVYCVTSVESILFLEVGGVDVSC